MILETIKPSPIAILPSRPKYQLQVDISYIERLIDEAEGRKKASILPYVYARLGVPMEASQGHPRIHRDYQVSFRDEDEVSSVEFYLRDPDEWGCNEHYVEGVTHMPTIVLKGIEDSTEWLTATARYFRDNGVPMLYTPKTGECTRHGRFSYQITRVVADGQKAGYYEVRWSPMIWAILPDKI